MATMVETVKAAGLIPAGAPMTVSTGLCPRIPEANQRRIWTWLEAHPALMTATWTGEPSDTRTLRSAAAAEVFDADEYWSPTKLGHRIYLAACPERVGNVKSTSPGLVGHNFWSYRGRTIAEIVAEYHDATPRRGGIVVNGKQFRFTQGDVAERAKGQVPAQPYVTYGVTVGPVLWPPRELMRVVTGEHLGENPNSQECMAHFEQLGLQTWTRTVYEGNKPEVHATRRRGPNSKS